MYTIEITEDEITTALNRLSRALTDMSPVMNSIGEQMEYQTEQRFEEGVSPDGSKWVPKSPTTIEAYTRRGLGVDFRPLFGPNADGLPLRKSFFRNYGADYVEIGTNKVQAAVMQFGATAGQFGAFIGKDKRGRDHFHSIPWGNIPARPFLGASEQDKSNIIDTVAEWLEGVANAKD